MQMFWLPFVNGGIVFFGVAWPVSNPWSPDFNNLTVENPVTVWNQAGPAALSAARGACLYR